MTSIALSPSIGVRFLMMRFPDRTQKPAFGHAFFGHGKTDSNIRCVVATCVRIFIAGLLALARFIDALARRSTIPHLVHNLALVVRAPASCIVRRDQTTTARASQFDYPPAGSNAPPSNALEPKPRRLGSGGGQSHKHGLKLNGAHRCCCCFSSK